MCGENIIYTGIVLTRYGTYNFLDNKRQKGEGLLFYLKFLYNYLLRHSAFALAK